MFNFKSKRRVLLVGIDIAIFISIYIAVAILMLLATPGAFDFIDFILHFVITTASVFLFRWGIKVYSNVWRYADAAAFLDLVLSDALGGLLSLFITRICLTTSLGAWRTASIVSMICLLTLVSRFVYQRHVLRQKSATTDLRLAEHRIPVAIVGAGSIGSILADELLCNERSKYVPLFFIDRDDTKVGAKVKGLPVYKNDSSVFEKITEAGISNVIIALPKITGDDANETVLFYTRSGFSVKIYDPPFADGDAPAGRGVLREIKVEDLLFRDTVSLTDADSLDYYKDKVVLVTGGGGSIGSEICRQIASLSPKRLVIFDIYENNAYDIQQELISRYGKTLNLNVEIGSVRDIARLDAVFGYYKPNVIFHAAAHKHVPLMEHSNCEAIKNNVLGTCNTADIAERHGVEKFILISTDKAVNPTNVMGASKRMCEMIVQCRKDSATKFAAVRFGNVLGSNGSVIPLFQRQISKGGPVTVTDKRIIRYFMTIPEAAGLVMQAGAMACAGELFVLDMGKPVRILELAENMIRLSGFEPYRDIDIIETGLRPGEKLYEELLVRMEGLGKTANDMIFVEHERELSREEVEDKLDILREAIAKAECEISSPIITEGQIRL